MSGTIRSGEAVKVLTDVLQRRKVPKQVYSFQKRKLHLMIGSRVVEFPCHAGMQFYALQDLAARLDMAIDEYFAAKTKRNQIDIEDVIRASA